MKKITSIFLALTIVAMSLAGCTQAPAPTPSSSSEASSSSSQSPEKTPEPQKQKGEALPYEDFDENGGADGYANGGDNENSLFYKNPDFYRMTSNENTTILTGFKTMQQTTEWSCGNVAALMVMRHLGFEEETEMSLAEKMGSHTDKDVADSKPGSANNIGEYGTNVEQLYTYFSSRSDMQVVETSYRKDYKSDELLGEDAGSDAGNLPGVFSSSALYASENDDDTEAWVDDAKDTYFVKWITDNLKANRPIMVEWGDWDGHWVVIIGYDNNGTPSIGDDTLIFADPYDSSDHWQDGYYYAPLERWFYMWQDRGVAPKPYQIQPYIIVDKK